jgi:hypothetical protein
MAVLSISTNVVSGNGAKALSLNTLTALDTFKFTRSAGMTALLYNPTSASITVKFVGSSPSPITPSGYGGTINTANGKSIAVAAGALVYLSLDDIWAFLNGSDPVSVENGAGLLLAIFN